MTCSTNENIMFTTTVNDLDSRICTRIGWNKLNAYLNIMHKRVCISLHQTYDNLTI